MNNRSGSQMEWRILMALFFAALAVRVIGLDHGVVLGDERINEAAKVLTGQLVPDQHFYPPLMNYLTAILFGFVYAVGRLIGTWPDAAAFRAQYFTDPTIFLVSARALVAAIGAISAPLFYRIARQLQFSKFEAVVVALFAIIAPISVYLSYIYKGDIPQASATVFVVLCLIQKWNSPDSRMQDFCLGLALTLALSIKHSFILLMLPLFVGYIAVFWPHLGKARLMASLSRVCITGFVLWPLLNIGILLDLENFLNFQKIQAVMSITEGASLLDALVLLVERALHWQSGLGLLMPIAFAVFPLLAHRAPYAGVTLMIWLAFIAGMVLVAHLVRLRQPEHLWVSFFVVMQLFGALTLVLFARVLRPLGWAMTGTAAILAMIGCIGIWRETLARPIANDIAVYLQTQHAGRKAVTGVPLPLQQSRAAQDYEFAIVDRTAAKYNIALPERAEERRVAPDAENAYFVLPIPAVMFGLEDATDAELEGKIRAYAWPPQEIDWTLDNWVDDDITLFVVTNLAYLQNETPSEMLRLFYNDLATRCAVAIEFAPRKPLFLERQITVLDCAKKS
ncbi:hypothetical protein NBRC116601_03720 [Cognatishimia sp. WU-CL00825]|uniref:phospholipid carrier-dependent glycosyltransferase n=1 Tax=Cognatishimia sp. WU-CL00825 TaxID=3127658 RepID=UPI003105A904